MAQSKAYGAFIVPLFTGTIFIKQENNIRFGIGSHRESGEVSIKLESTWGKVTEW